MTQIFAIVSSLKIKLHLAPDRCFMLLFYLLFTAEFIGQSDKSITALKTDEEIVIDGILSEEIWKNSQLVGEFYQNFPADTAFAKTRTEVMLCFDNKNLYVAAICYDDHKNMPYIVESLKRDFSYPRSDAFAIYLDPFNSKINGQSFAVNPYGTQREGSLENGGNFGVTTAWDNKWFAEVSEFEKGWMVEMKIPFKTLRYNAGSESWGVNFSRNNLKLNENSSWVPVPRNFNVATLVFTGKLIWQEKPQPAGTNISLIPYLSGGYQKDFSTKGHDIIKGIGMDAKIALSSSLNLDLTVNPDFSQVDVDQQITNLSRFSLFFPERRQFFIENSDLFGRFGFSKIRPFFSRKIGLHAGRQIPILGGFRLSGMLDKKWRIGIMSLQTKEEESLNLNAQNYMVGAVQRQLGVGSNIGAIVVNRQGFDTTGINYSDFNRVLGIDLNLASKDSKWRGKVFYHQSFSRNLTDYAHASWAMYSTRKFAAHWNHEYVGKNYRTDVGFVPRISQYNQETNEFYYSAYWRLEPTASFTHFPKNKKINAISPTLYSSQYYNADFSVSELVSYADGSIQFSDNSTINVRGTIESVVLPFKTDVTFLGNEKIAAGRYDFFHCGIGYSSSTTRMLEFGSILDYGAYYTGSKGSAEANLSYRIKRFGKLGVSGQFNQIYIPEFNQTSRLLLIGPKIEWSFTRSLFFTTFVQYNTQIENVNMNIRLQYRFKPMSDLFIVYTDNYNPYNFSVKNRALVVKLVYWLNV